MLARTAAVRRLAHAEFAAEYENLWRAASELTRERIEDYAENTRKFRG
jgi:hypothetical protein